MWTSCKKENKLLQEDDVPEQVVRTLRFHEEREDCVEDHAREIGAVLRPSLRAENKSTGERNTRGRGLSAELKPRSPGEVGCATFCPGPAKLWGSRTKS